MLCEAWSRSGWVVCAAVGNSINMYSTSTGRKLETLSSHTSPVTCIVSSATGRVYSGSIDKTVLHWDLHSKQVLTTMKGHTAPIWFLALCGDRLFSASEDGSVMQWDAETGEKMGVPLKHSTPVRCMVEFQGLIYTGADDGTLACLEVEHGTVRFQVKAHAGPLTCLLIGEDGSLFSGSADSQIKRIDPNRGDCLSVLKGHNDLVSSLLIWEGSLFSASRDCTIRRWDYLAGRVVETFEFGTISFKQKGAWLCALDDGSVHTSKASEGEKYTKVDHADGMVSLRTQDGLYLSANAAGQISASSREIGHGEKFDLIDNGDDTLSIRTSYSSFIGITKDGVATASRFTNAEPEPNEQFRHSFVESHWSGITSLLVVNGALMSGSADRAVKLWDPDSGMLLASLESRTGVICLLEAGGSPYAAAARGTPLRLPKPRKAMAGGAKRVRASKVKAASSLSSRSGHSSCGRAGSEEEEDDSGAIVE